jgi:hypothetical protein
LIGILRYQTSSDIDKSSLSFVDTLFGEFLRSRTIEDKKPHGPRKHERKSEEPLEVSSDIEVRYSSLARTEDEFNNYESAIRDYARAKSPLEDRDVFDDLLFSLTASRLPIVTYPGTWYEILGFTLEPSLHYTKYLKAKYRSMAAKLNVKVKK